MAAGVPIVASDLPPMRRILEETRAGVLSTQPGDSASLASAVVDLLRDGALRSRLAGNGRASAAEKCKDWREDERRFLDFFPTVPS